MLFVKFEGRDEEELSRPSSRRPLASPGLQWCISDTPTSDMSPVRSCEDRMSGKSVSGPAGLSHCSQPKESPEVMSNRTYVMYHGTTSRNAESIQLWGFRASPNGTLGPGVYLSRDHHKASLYPIGHPSCDRVVIKVVVDVGRVLAIRHHSHPLQRSWHLSGYDSAWMPKWTMLKTLEESCVWDPRRIRILQIMRHCELPKLCRSAPHGERLEF